MRYKKNKNGKYSAFYSDEIKIKIHKLNINNLSEEEICVKIKKWNKEIDILTDKLFVLAYLNGYAGNTALIYLAIHHLNTDGVSWWIIKNDLEKIYNYLLKAESENKNISKITATDILGPKGSSPRQWLDSLLNYGNRTAHWEKMMPGIEKSNKIIKSLTVNTIQTEEILLDGKTTKRLLRKTDVILLAALNTALSKLTGLRNNYIAMESHSRGEIDKTIDISDTVGWFANPYPIKIGQAKKPSDNGIEYTALSLRKAMKLPHVFFNYQGNFDNNAADKAWQFTNLGGAYDYKDINKFLLKNYSVYITCNVLGGRLKFRIISKLSPEKMLKFTAGLKEILTQTAAKL
jgi:hypothetical protein